MKRTDTQNHPHMDHPKQDDVLIAIKTKDRVKRFRDKTYNKILQKYGFDDQKVFLFVSTEKDLNDYKEAYPKCNVVLGPLGIANIDNFIVDFFQEGQKYIYLNDDVSALYKLVDEKSMKEIEVDEMQPLVDRMFATMQQKGYTYGGFYPVDNPFYMARQKEQQREDFCLVMDPFSFIINNKSVRMTPIPIPMEDGTTFMGDKTDFEKTIQHYKSRGGILRLNNYAIKVEYYGKHGGYQGRNAFTEKFCAEFIAKKYPEYISGVKTKKLGRTSLVLKRKIKKV